MAKAFGQIIADAFCMDEATWERHANPWSVYTRMATVPFIVLAFWSRVWIGWWCLLPIAVLGVWLWLNPRAFAPPKSTNNWASKAVLGERVWLNRKNVPIPAHHSRAATLLSVIGAIGVPPFIYGLVMLEGVADAVGHDADVSRQVVVRGPHGVALPGHEGGHARISRVAALKPREPCVSRAPHL